jgi:hypothetical protein
LHNPERRPTASITALEPRHTPFAPDGLQGPCQLLRLIQKAPRRRARDLDPLKLWASVAIAAGCVGYLVILRWLA